MQLREVLGDAARAAPPVEVTALAYDNRLVEPGTLFFCVPGFTRDGHEFARDAVARGAAALVVERPLDLGVPEVRVDDVRAAMAPAAAAINGDPTAVLRAVGITGTNGKTTTAFLVRGLLEAAGRPTGLVGTVNAVVGGEERAMVRTTPEAIDLQRMFAEMRDAGDEAVVMEVSSHALALRRADAIHWAVAIFTNLTQDHLDFHPTMEDYFLAKRRLFEAGPEVAVINVDDAYGMRLAYDFPDAVRIGIDSLHAQVRARGIESDARGSRFSVDGLELRSPLPGRFNVLNVLGAVAAVRALGVDDATIADGLARAVRVPRRGSPRRARPRPLRAGRRGPAVRRPRRLRPHPGLARQRAARGAAARDRGRDRRLRRRRRPRPCQAPAHGRRRVRARGRRHRHVRQPAQRGPARDRRPDPRGLRRGRRGRGRPARRDRAGDRDGRARRRRGDRREGPRAGPGVRRRSQGAVRRRHRRPRGAACATGRLTASRRRRARGSPRPRRTPAAPRGWSSTREQWGPGTSSSGSSARTSTTGGSPRRRSSPARGACSSAPRTPRRRPRRTAASCSRPTTRSRRSGASRPRGGAHCARRSSA